MVLALQSSHSGNELLKDDLYCPGGDAADFQQQMHREAVPTGRETLQASWASAQAFYLQESLACIELERAGME